MPKITFSDPTIRREKNFAYGDSCRRLLALATTKQPIEKRNESERHPSSAVDRTLRHFLL